MKTIYKSYKFRIKPTKKQEELLAKHFGCCRFVFNRFLIERKEAYLKDKMSLNYYDTSKALTVLKRNDEFDWLREVNGQSLQFALRILDASYNNFFRKKSKYPKFKNKYSKQSFTLPQRVKIKEGKLVIPKFQEGIKINLHRKMEGRILFATVSKTDTSKYYISITCEVEHDPLPKAHSQVGVDTGIKDLAVLSDGRRYKNIQALRLKLKKLKYEQRQLSKKQRGSNSRNKQRHKVAKIHEKISHTRKDYLHKVSTDIIKNHDIVCIEDLAVKNMMQNRHLSQALSDVGLGTLYFMLKYKADWNDKTVIKIDRFFASSKICHECNWVNQDLTLSDRKWTCENCHADHDRDINAAKNILKQGMLSGLGINSDSKQKQVEALSLDKSMKPEAHAA